MRFARTRLIRLTPLAVTLVSISLTGGCADSTPPPAEHPTIVPQASASAAPPWTPPAPPAAAAAAFDPVAVGMTVDGVRHLCDDHLARAQALVDYVKRYQGAPAERLTYDETLGRWDEISMEVQDAGSFAYLMGVAHPDAAVRDAAKECQPKSDAFTTSLYLDAGLAAVIKAYAAKGDALRGERARLLSDVLRDFHRNGVDLPADQQATLRALNHEITELGQKFETNIASSRGEILVTRKQLDGLPKEWIAKHPANADGKIAVSTDYPDYIPFSTYANDRKAAADLYVQFTNRGGDENVALLGELLKRRRAKANLLGYATWAAYQIEPRMAKTPEAVHTFLATVADAVREPAKGEYAELVKEHVRLGGKATDALSVADRAYLQDKVRARSYRLDSKEVASYFEVGAVIKGLLDVTSKMYALEYRAVAANAWHPDVVAYEVWSGGKQLGKIYLDLYSRPDKYKHAAEFQIRAARRMQDGSYQMPAAALECNFPKPGADKSQPALMGHDQVGVFFHEFGHVLHNILTTSELATYAGTNTVQDFVEAPSQMFEDWVWSRDVLDLFARHYKTGAKIPDALFGAMTRARAFGRAVDTQRQVFLATLDFEYHVREPGFDSTKVLAEIQNSVDSFAYMPGTHFQSSFGHLIGYDAGYYSYEWALSLARDSLTRFKKEGFLNPTTAAAWRENVLSKGGGVDEKTLVARFLGREPNSDAYIAFLKGQN
jgi:thimet oligopeptidase